MKINKKRKLKNYFKLGLLLIGIPFTLINCEKDIEIIDLTESNQQVFDPIKNLTLDEALNDIEFSQISISLNLTKKNLAHKNGQDDVIYIDTKNIIKIIKKDYITYTFLIINKKQENKNSFTNLIVEKSTNKTRGYLAHYLPTNEYLNKKAKGIKTPFKGTVSFSPFTEDIGGLLSALNKKISNTSKNNLQSRTSDCYYQTVTIETSCASGQHWPGENCDFIGSSLAASSRFVEALVCDESGFGGSDIIYEISPIYINENENIGIGGGDGSGYIPPSGSTYPNLPAELTDSIDPITDLVFPDKINIDSSFDKYPCQKIIVADAYGLCSPLTQLVLDAFENNENTNLVFNTNNNIPSTSNGGTSKVTVNNLYTNTCDLTVTIRESYILVATDLSIARTVIHESLHAVLVHMLERGDFQLSSGSADTGYENLVEEYIKYTNGFPNNIGMAHHELMTNYVESIASSLSVFGYNNGHSNSFNYYKKLAWGGLQNTPTFKALYPKYINPDDKTNNPNNVNPIWLDITNTIAVETENVTYIYEHPNGNTYEFNPKGNTPNATTPCN